MSSDNLFSDGSQNRLGPLADRIRPRKLDDFVGQDTIVGEGGILRYLIEKDRLISFLLWGPPGSGKTTIAHLVTHYTSSFYQLFSAVTSSITELKKIIHEAEDRWDFQQMRTVIFVDEIHHFNKSQQDAFLPYIEQGKIIFIGATTENPSFSINSALLSRLKVFILKSLQTEDILQILQRALRDRDYGLGTLNLEIEEKTLTHIAELSYGDARVALNIMETAALVVENNGKITDQTVQNVVQKNPLRYDKSGEEHYNLISALHKSLRDSDVDAALYWVMRMLESGENPLYIVRRLVRFASEDVGMADPKALGYAINAKDAYTFLGTPEGNLAILQITAYLACAPKSNALYKAQNLIQQDIEQYGPLPVPMVIRNAPTSFMKSVGYGENYIYAHDRPDQIIQQSHRPEELEDKTYYIPTLSGLEEKISRYLSEYRRRKKNPDPDSSQS